ncbi:MAG: GNAT family N-acetyltransferase [Acidiferrobacteraceae bacterium]|nr:GNAT family N-acetyltransferase [Acidiferrobacteraceae bacterium]|tara:strand:- start:6799 stop:7281 length:483 start_codon:yes stop_codon:yes gene_type:complete
MIKVRRATVADTATISRLLDNYSSIGRLLPRTREEIVERLSSFFVSEQDSVVTGCVSLEVFTSELGEIRSLAVEPNFLKSGNGSSLVKNLENEAMRLGLQRLIALTYVPDFFRKLGFEITPMNSLPEKVFGVCVNCPKFNNCDEIAMVKHIEENNGKHQS